MSVTTAQPGETFISTQGPEKEKVSYVVAESCSASAGRWYCVTCDEGFSTQLAKDSHINNSAEHKLAWVCFEHGPETP